MNKNNFKLTKLLLSSHLKPKPFSPLPFSRLSFKNPSLSSPISRACFGHSASYPHQKTNEGLNNPFHALVTKRDTELASSVPWDDQSRIEDRFHLSQITDVKKVFSLLRQANYKYPLNDLVHFLRRIVEISDEKHLHLSPKNSMELRSFVEEIKRNLRHATQEYPLIGTYAWCFKKLDHNEDAELWMTLGDHIIDGRFYPNFNETICGIEGFTALDGIADQGFIDEVYNKLEKILVLTILEVSINHYKRISESLVKVHRFTEYVFENIEGHLLHFINTHELQYDLRLMLDILAAFAVSGNGSEHLFYSFEEIFSNFYELEAGEQEDLSHGDFISKIVQTYALAKMKHTELVLDEKFKGLVHELVIGDGAHYTLEELVNVVQFGWTFGFENQEKINKLLDGRLFEVKGEMKPDDMIRYIDLKVERDYEGDHLKLPKEVMRFFDSYLNKNMEKQSHGQVYNYMMELEDRHLMSEKGELMNHLIVYVGGRLHIYDFEELCYFFWLFNKYRNYVKLNDSQVQNSFNQIKDHIRLHSAFSKGRLQIDSNFYKMLEVVSGSDFLSQGEYPDW